MTPTLIVLALVALGIGVVVWAVRKKPETQSPLPREGDTAWNDPVTPGDGGTPVTPVTPSQDPRP